MITLVVPTCDRDATRLDRLLTTVEWQTVPFHEVIVVDFSTDQRMQKENEKVCTHRAIYQYTPQPTFNLSHAWNVGIRMADPGYIACTGVDFLFSSNFCHQLESLMDSGVEFGRAQAALLPEEVDWSSFGGFGGQTHWSHLLVLATRRHFLGHAISCARRDWWFEVRGYDERMEGGLGVMDGDIRKRAQDYGLKMGYVKYTDAPVLHQYHPKSPFKHHNQLYREEHPALVKNPDGWGEYHEVKE